jgi:uncharacterized membrane protein
MDRVEALIMFAAGVSSLLVAFAVAIVTAAALVAAVALIRETLAGCSVVAIRARVWPRLGSAMALGLLFGFAADLAASLATPGWNAIGKSVAIGAICVLLDPFLGRGPGSLRPGRGRRSG